MDGQNLGELVITLDGGKLKVEFYKLHPIDDTIAGDRAIADEIDKFKKTVTAVVFASRGYSIDQPLARGAARRAQHIHRHRCEHNPRQPRHRRHQQGHQSRYRLHRSMGSCAPA